MDFKEVKAIITGYNEYFYTMLGCKVKLEYNKKYKELIIKRLFPETEYYVVALTFNIGNVKSGVLVEIKKYSSIIYYFEDRFGREIEYRGWTDEGFFTITKIEELHKLFSVLEELRFFGGRRL